MKNLVFDIWAEFGHYKQIYMTTSALSYPIPFKTALYGLIGSIIGLPKETYLDYFQIEGDKPSCMLSIQILSRLRKLRLPVNLLSEPGKRIKEHKPTNMDFVLRPKYRIFFRHTDENIYFELRSRLETHTTFYTPVLGLANLIANFRYLGEFESVYKEATDDFISIHSIIPQSKLLAFNTDDSFYKNNKIISVAQYALEMKPDREVIRRDEIIFDEGGLPISCRVQNYEQIAFNEQTVNVCFI